MPRLLPAMCLLTTASLGAANPCAKCHPQETARFLASKMGRSVRTPELRPDGEVTHALSGSTIEIRERGGRMIQRVTEKGFTAEYEIDYEVGADLIGASYLVRIGDEFFQAPASWYNSHGWDLSPGYQNLPVIDFNRSINSTCLLCHTGNTRFLDADGRRVVDTDLTPISCERCHGDAQEHLRRPVAGTIVNPAKLSGSVRESVCEQCHLEGEARILNPGMKFTDFHPGRDLSEVRPVYVDSGAEAAGSVVSQFEQLAQSQCYRASGGRLWCGTCHDPHGAPVNRVAQMHAICTSCHSTLSKREHPTEQADCLACHMPRSKASDVPHTAITDHRILRRPIPLTRPAGPPRSLRAWSDPAPQYRDRDLGVAEAQVGTERQARPLAEAGAAILDRLSSAPGFDDPAALSALSSVVALEGRLWSAVALARRAAEQQPESASYALDLGVDLEHAGDLYGARRELNRAIGLDPFFDPPYKALFDLYAGQNRDADALETLDRYLKLNPKSIDFRAERAEFSSSTVAPLPR